ncbi:hypothetical protein F441_10698 [Phytophthora nicotianae CJ01A1]|nr:hypothetical protein L914_06923 [Phytophthora nicotianae]ETP14334.1 hypothetical protein F441_10698 [Phytophthora nicotianae CJ01A1]
MRSVWLPELGNMDSTQKKRSEGMGLYVDSSIFVIE